MYPRKHMTDFPGIFPGCLQSCDKGELAGEWGNKLGWKWLSIDNWKPNTSYFNSLNDWLFSDHHCISISFISRVYCICVTVREHPTQCIINTSCWQGALVFSQRAKSDKKTDKHANTPLTPSWQNSPVHRIALTTGWYDGGKAELDICLKLILL